MGRGTGRRIRTAGFLLAVTPVAAFAQERLARACAASDEVGSLGITGIQCERCRFITEQGRARAVFYTEPVILGVRPTHPAAEHLRPGDVLVAIDGSLITTSDGWDRFSNLPAEGTVVLRVRREGRVREVRVPLEGACPSPDPTVPAVTGRPVPPPPLKAVVPPAAGAAAVDPVRTAVPEPPEPGEQAVSAEPAPTLPLLPPPPGSLAPHASLGFGFRCTECGFDGETWGFSEPPEVQGVTPYSSAARAGLQAGDRIVFIDGLDITSEDGGRRFARIEPGQLVVWTIEREGRRRQVRTTAQERRSSMTFSTTQPTEALGRAELPAEAPVSAEPSMSVSPPTTAVTARPPLRFAGSVGNVTVEVRGGEVTVTEHDGGRLIIIRTGDSEIRIQAPVRDGSGR